MRFSVSAVPAFAAMTECCSTGGMCRTSCFEKLQ